MNNIRDKCRYLAETFTQIEVLKVLGENRDKCFTYEEIKEKNGAAVNQIISAVKKFELYDLITFCAMDGYGKSIKINGAGIEVYLTQVIVK